MDKVLAQAIMTDTQGLVAGGMRSRSTGWCWGGIVVHPGAGHAFHADYRPSYRADAAQDGWKRCVAWFEKHLA